MPTTTPPDGLVWATPQRAAAYQKRLDCYLKIVQYTDFPLEIVKIPFEDKEIIGHLHLPETERPPVVIWSGGIDGWKASGMDIKQKFLDEGFAVFAMDLPGTGESQWPLEANSDRIYSAVIDYLKERGDVDGENIGLYFGSFSGVFAIKLALVDPDVTASVNHSGGIHLFFHPPVSQLPPLNTSIGMRAFATITALRLAKAPVEEILQVFGQMSLKDQGLLKRVAGQAPLLSIYGDQDDLMPIQDLDVLRSSGVETEALVYEGAGHMAWEHADDHQPKMLASLQEALNEGRRVASTSQVASTGGSNRKDSLARAVACGGRRGRRGP